MAEKISAKMSYLTQIHTAWDGKEQRMALRQEPRRYVAYDYIGCESWQSQYLRMLAYKSGTQLIELPLWHAATLLEDPAYEGQTTIRVPPEAMWSFRNIGSVEMWRDDKRGGGKYEIKYLAANGVMGLKKQLKRNYKSHLTTIIPVFYGILQDDDSFANLHGDAVQMTLNLELFRNQRAPDFPAAWDMMHDEPMEGASRFAFGLPAQYLGAEVFRFAPQWEDDISASYTKNANRLDYKSGVFRYDLKGTNPAETREFSIAGLSKAEIHNIERFFMRHKGAWKSFYAPTWLNDIDIEGRQPAGQIFLLASFPYHWKYYAKSSRRRLAVIFYTDGSAEILPLAGFSQDETGTLGKVYLEMPLKHEILPQNVRMISFFTRCRFAEDDLVIDYETTGAATVRIIWKEVDT